MFAWIENDRVRDAVADPSVFHPDVAKYYDTELPDDVKPGATLVEGGWQNPTDLIVVSVVEAPKVSPVEFKLLFTAQERVAIKQARNTDAVVDDFYDIIEDPRLTTVDLGLQSTQDALAYMVSVDLLTATRREEILLGVLK